ncbi:MAG: response regulator [Pseudomonadota bacterium]
MSDTADAIITASDQAPHLLVVDDDDRIRELLKKYLVDNGCRVTVAANAQEAREKMRGIAFDLMVLDIMMPGETGLELTQSLRDARSDVPILLLTARGLPEDRIEGLERGADDYLAKPFEPRELLLRINALLRRTTPPPPPTELTFGASSFNTARGELRCDGDLVKLTSSELSLLRALAETPGKPVSRLELSRRTSAALERSVDVQVTRVRKKIEPDPRAPIYLQTVRGVGYVLMPD